MNLSVRISMLIVAFGVAAFLVRSANAQVTVSVDMDTTLDDIQDRRAADPGESFPVDIVFEVGPSGLSSYGVSVQFDTFELDLLGATPALELLPPDFDFNLTQGVAGVFEDIGGGLGQVSTFEAATLGMGPAESNFIVGTIDFAVATALDDGLPNIIPGLFNTGIDGFFDNAGRSVEPVFEPGSVVPEPSSIALMVLGCIGVVRRKGRAS